MRLVQFFSREGLRAVGMPDEAGRRLKVLEGVERVYDLALLALQQGQSLVLAAEERVGAARSEEHTSELQSLMRISYAVFCLKKKTINTNTLKKRHNKRELTHTTNYTHTTHL